MAYENVSCSVPIEKSRHQNVKVDAALISSLIWVNNLWSLSRRPASCRPVSCRAKLGDADFFRLEKRDFDPEKLPFRLTRGPLTLDGLARMTLEAFS